MVEDYGRRCLRQTRPCRANDRPEWQTAHQGAGADAKRLSQPAFRIRPSGLIIPPWAWLHKHAQDSLGATGSLRLSWSSRYCTSRDAISRESCGRSTHGKAAESGCRGSRIGGIRTVTLRSHGLRLVQKPRRPIPQSDKRPSRQQPHPVVTAYAGAATALWTRMLAEKLPVNEVRAKVRKILPARLLPIRRNIKFAASGFRYQSRGSRRACPPLLRS